MQVNKISFQTFGSLIPKEGVVEYLQSLDMDSNDYISINRNRVEQEANPFDVYLRVVDNKGRKSLSAEIGHKTFIENVYRTPAIIIKEASEIATRLWREKTDFQTRYEGYSGIIKFLKRI